MTLGIISAPGPDHGMGHRRRTRGSGRRGRLGGKPRRNPLIYGKPGYKTPYFLAKDIG